MFKIHNINSDYNGFGVLAKILSGNNVDKVSNTLILDFSTCDFIDANMASPLLAVISKLKEKNISVKIQCIKPNVQIILQKNQFLREFGYPLIVDNNQTTLPCKDFTFVSGVEFYQYLDCYMNGRGIPKMSLALIKKFKQSLFEVFQNSVAHSDSNLGVFVCGQYFPNKKRLDFTMTDVGIGIRESVRKYLKNRINSIEAIKWALKSGNSTRVSNKPGGLGLNLIHDFIDFNKGKIQIVSRYGFYEYTEGNVNYTKLSNDFLGTCVNIEINTGDSNSYQLASENNMN